MALFACRASWKVLFGYNFRRKAYINLLELEAICSLARRLRCGGSTNMRCVVLVHSMVAIGAASKGRSSARRLNCVLRRLGAHCLAAGLWPEFIWVPAWANPADAPSREVL